MDRFSHGEIFGKVGDVNECQNISDVGIILLLIQLHSEMVYLDFFAIGNHYNLLFKPVKKLLYKSS